MNTNKKWTDESVAALKEAVGSENPVSAATVEKVAASMETSVRSIASKLRSLKIAVDSLAKVKTSAFSPEDTEALREFVEANVGKFTYSEISENFQDGKHSPKAIQGKLLSLELTKAAKPATKLEAVKTYTPEQEDSFVAMAKAGAFVEEIAAKLGKTLDQVRGKALSLLRAGTLVAIPRLKESHAATKADVLEGLDVSAFTVAQLVEKTGKTERGIKTMLTKRELVAVDYPSKGKKAKAEAAKVAA
jgi:predicted transcriptional regulator